ncbi:VanZ family protein [Parasporobacterium paucivorans]|uniref:VanZ like family protein n=1 Tax=Parasporobacterium paucivorans DSM 15970 TaxID=1122934 RepID=A0A1M6GTR7_9FIRM|nr:VanZ family protein [Parasporobacterium paucivorans]SHJ13355.1 VanZ like family protein [Parasporobacterium paucivorans DSM 15970]
MRNRKKIIAIGLVVLCMLLIFLFSSQPAPQSSELSMEIGEAIGKVFVEGFDEMTEGEQADYAMNIDYAIRKASHALEFVLLGGLFMAVFGIYRLRIRMPVALLGTALYAVSDELHQHFVMGRAGQGKDVLIDSIGAVLGILVYAGVVLLKKRRTKTKVSRQEGKRPIE